VFLRVYETCERSERVDYGLLAFYNSRRPHSSLTDGDGVALETDMKWLRRILIALAVLLVIAVALPFFISLDD
jgi:hypothetical protein